MGHGRDARSTLKAMRSSIRHILDIVTNTINPVNLEMWRLEVKRQCKIALRLVKKHQVKEKTRRVREHNESLSRAERQNVGTDSRANDVVDKATGSQPIP